MTSLPAELDGSTRPLEQVRNGVMRVIHGKGDVIELALVALVAGGHLLIEDIPGVGKSTLAHALATAVGGSFRRVQFTSDLLPADLIGVNVWRSRDQDFEFHPGPIFANVVLADEVNRAPPRTQSALLEAMGEKQVSVDGKTRPLPAPFMVIATQNPEEHHGTYPLPESQRDRFLLRVAMGYAAPDIEVELMCNPEATAPASPEDTSATPALVEALQNQARKIHLHRDLAHYAQAVLRATREHDGIRLGVSTRGGLGWIAAARAKSLLDGRDRVLTDDLQDLAIPALAHRIQPMQAATGSEYGLAATLLREIVATTPVPT